MISMEKLKAKNGRWWQKLNTGVFSGVDADLNVGILNGAFLATPRTTDSVKSSNRNY
jgi:GH25 family lysozyme M1 (1,4-beta-N-acetylmuramidase)